jgi:hypothetical protein
LSGDVTIPKNTSFSADADIYTEHTPSTSACRKLVEYTIQDNVLYTFYTLWKRNHQ